MFQRRIPQTTLQKTRQTLWPKMGWWRLLKYYRARITRLSSTAESIAINLAGGSAMSLTPFFFIHVFGAMGFAWLIGARVNFVAAMVGTFVGNPWTFPFFLYAEHALGNWVLKFFGTAETNDSEHISNTITDQQNESFWSMLNFFWHNFTDIFVPMAIGGSILAIISFPLYYFFYLYLVRGAQRARKLRMKRKQKKLFNKKSRGDQ